MVRGRRGDGGGGRGGGGGDNNVSFPVHVQDSPVQSSTHLPPTVPRRRTDRHHYHVHTPTVHARGPPFSIHIKFIYIIHTVLYSVQHNIYTGSNRLLLLQGATSYVLHT